MRRLIQKAWAWIVELFTGRPPDKGPPLRKITNVNVEIDMSGDVLLTWDNPTERTDGVQTDGSDFEIRIAMRAVGAPSFTPMATIPGTDTPEFPLVDQAGGDYEFELVLADLRLDRTQPPILAPFSVPVGDLNPITNVNVTVT